MSHDALCPSLGKGTLPVIDLCACRLIARVREDESSLIKQAREHERSLIIDNGREGITS